MRKLSLRRRGAVVAGVVLAGGLVAGGATAYADNSAPVNSGTGHAAASSHRHRHPRRAALRRLIARGVHGQVTVRNRASGSFVVREWQRGKVAAVSGDHLTVTSTDGASWTWTVGKKALITRDGRKTDESVLKKGDTVLVVGRQAGGANDAGRIFAPSQAQLAKAGTDRAAAHAGGSAVNS